MHFYIASTHAIHVESYNGLNTHGTYDIVHKCWLVWNIGSCGTLARVKHWLAWNIGSRGTLARVEQNRRGLSDEITEPHLELLNRYVAKQVESISSCVYYWNSVGNCQVKRIQQWHLVIYSVRVQRTLRTISLEECFYFLKQTIGVHSSNVSFFRADCRFPMFTSATYWLTTLVIN